MFHENHAQIRVRSRVPVGLEALPHRWECWRRRRRWGSCADQRRWGSCALADQRAAPALRAHAGALHGNAGSIPMLEALREHAKPVYRPICMAHSGAARCTRCRVTQGSPCHLPDHPKGHSSPQEQCHSTPNLCKIGCWGAAVGSGLLVGAITPGRMHASGRRQLPRTGRRPRAMGC